MKQNKSSKENEKKRNFIKLHMKCNVLMMLIKCDSWMYATLAQCVSIYWVEESESVCMRERQNGMIGVVVGDVSGAGAGAGAAVVAA